MPPLSLAQLLDLEMLLLVRPRPAGSHAPLPPAATPRQLQEALRFDLLVVSPFHTFAQHAAALGASKAVAAAAW